MTTVINTSTPTPAPAESNSNAGLIVGLVFLLVVLFLAWAYGLPYLRSATQNSGTNVNVPRQIDVNVNTPEGGNPADTGSTPQ